jgi:hypothetical protein
MPHPKGKKTIGIYVPDRYPYTGKQLKEAIDVLFGAMWEKLSRKSQQALMEQHGKFIAMLDWEADKTHG